MFNKQIYKTPEERDSIIAAEEAAGNTLYLEQNHADENALIFVTPEERDVLKTPKEKEIDERVALTSQVNDLIIRVAALEAKL